MTRPGATTVVATRHGSIRPDDRSPRSPWLSAPTVAIAPTSPSARDGFDWGDAAVGAGAGLGVALLAGGVAAAFRLRSPHLAT